MGCKRFTICHDRDRCIGCGSCELEAPQTWGLSEEDGLSNLKEGKNKNGVHVSTIDEFDLEDNLRAEKNCPVNIIRVEQGSKKKKN